MSKKQYLVLGLGRFGSSIAHTLASNGCEVLVVDKNEEKVELAAEYATHAIQTDFTDEECLKNIGASNFDVAIVSSSGDLEASVMATIILKELGVNFVLAKAQNKLHKKVLMKVGADKVILPEREMGIKVANNLMHESVLDYIELSKDYSIAEITVKPEWISKTLEEVGLRKNYGLNVIAHKSEDGTITVNPDSKLVFFKNDIVIAIGENQNIKKLK